MKKRLDFKHFLSRKTGVQLFGSSDRLYSRFFFLLSSNYFNTVLLFEQGVQIVPPLKRNFHSIFSLGLDRKGWIAAAVGVVGMCVNCQDCEAVGKLFADLWEKACLFPSGCEWLFHRHKRQFSIFP